MKPTKVRQNKSNCILREVASAPVRRKYVSRTGRQALLRTVPFRCAFAPLRETNSQQKGGIA
jgi:hypothetical protein